MSQDGFNLEDYLSKLTYKIFDRIWKSTGKKIISYYNKRAAAKVHTKKYASQLARRYGNIRVMGMDCQIPLNDIYIKINLLEKIKARMSLTPEELQKDELKFKERDRIIHERADAINVVKDHSKLMLLGKPGAGKTTLLKYLALNYKKTFPIFISLKDWAESKHFELIDFIEYELDICGVPGSKPFIEELLEEGKCLLLLDGLDEASGSDRFHKMHTQIRDFADKYGKNRFVISCRVAAYNYFFSRFTDAEIADFDEEQSMKFIHLWFGKDKIRKAEKCIEEIKKKEKAPILELTQNPLLLTLLCLTFEQTDSFPSNRAELYKEALEALLEKWDNSRNINKRSMIYRKLSIPLKEKLFSELAFDWFKDYKFFVTKEKAESDIKKFLVKHSKIIKDALEPFSSKVLSEIEAQHGILIERANNIFSFSHLTFQEYYTARYIIDNIDQFDPGIGVINSYSWREVFLLTSGLLKEADDFFILMREEIDSLIITNEKIKSLLKWVNEKGTSVITKNKPEAIRAFYVFIYLNNNISEKTKSYLYYPIDNIKALYKVLDNNLDLYLQINVNQGLGMSLELNHELPIDFILSDSCARDYVCDLSNDFSHDNDIYPYLGLGFDCSKEQENEELTVKLIELKDRVTDKKKDNIDWNSWEKELSRVVMKHRNIGHDFGLDEKDYEVLEDYINANSLLIDCLNGCSNVSPEVRVQILGTLLLFPEKK